MGVAFGIQEAGDPIFLIIKEDKMPGKNQKDQRQKDDRRQVFEFDAGKKNHWEPDAAQNHRRAKVGLEQDKQDGHAGIQERNDNVADLENFHMS